MTVGRWCSSIFFPLFKSLLDMIYIIIVGTPFGSFLFLHCRFLKYSIWSGKSLPSGGMYHSLRIVSAPGVQSSFPIKSIIIGVVNRVPSACDRRSMFRLSSTFYIFFESEIAFYWMEVSFEMLFQSSLSTGICILDHLDLVLWSKMSV